MVKFFKKYLKNVFKFKTYFYLCIIKLKQNKMKQSIKSLAAERIAKYLNSLTDEVYTSNEIALGQHIEVYFEAYINPVTAEVEIEEIEFFDRDNHDETLPLTADERESIENEINYLK